MKTFAQLANADLVAWKQRTPTLAGIDPAPAPYSKRPDGPKYEFCLPLEHAARNLLPEARDLALDRFRRLGIRWHDGSTRGTEQPPARVPRSSASTRSCRSSTTPTHSPRCSATVLPIDDRPPVR